jgi:MGT family glycosyltransferase
MLAIARHLHSLGYQVTFHTGELFRQQVESAGLRFVPLIARADYDYRDLSMQFPDREKHEVGPERINYDIKHLFGDPIPDQARGLRQIMAESPVDLILAEGMFMGVFPLLLGRRGSRPPIIGVGVLPPLLSSIDIRNNSIPDSTPEGREENRKLDEQFQAIVAPGSAYVNQLLVDMGASALPGPVFDCIYTMPDLFLQCTADSFEFPRSDMPPGMRFIGPVLPSPTVNFQPPAWWRELDVNKPLVLVTQGTFANHNLGELVEPALLGLADEDVQVIVGLGRDTEAISIPVPANAHVESFIPFDMVLPRADVFVTNGGYGAVNHALSAGVPMVIAGTTDDKAFIAARVEWTGAGINLKTDNPSAEQVRDAVRTLLTDVKYRDRAREVQTNFATYNAFTEIVDTIEAVLDGRERDAHRL